MSRKIRILSQLSFFSIFTVFLLLLTRENLVQKLHVEWFLQLNPLVTVLTSLASRSFIFHLSVFGLIVAVLTIILGRFFCGYICPLGALIDFSDHFFIRKSRNNSRRPPIYLHRLKYVLLYIVLVCAIFGVLFPLFMDPISLLTRIMTLCIAPALSNLGSSGKSIWLTINNFLNKNGSVNNIQIIDPSYSFFAVFFLAIIIAGGLWDRRFWCQYVCPSGAFFAFLSRFSIFRRQVSTSSCNNCRLCSTYQCPTRAIDFKNHSITSTSECLLCGLCSNNKRSCSRLVIAAPVKKETTGVDIHRRHLLAGITAGVITVPLLKTGIPSESLEPELIRPPGSTPEPDFLSRCIACGECMKVCPNHALGPCGFLDGIGRIGTPKLIAQKGFCKDNCIACSNVCPTGALFPVSAEDKPFVKVGTAIVDTSKCLSWRGIRRCMVCESVCPYNAITLEEVGLESEPKSGPMVNMDLCMGCGKCEKYCPVSTNAAIHIISDGERRIRPGIAVITRKRREKIIRLRQSRADE
ncbi:MAG TPA: 4Fe-4S binding protein [Chitinispirillaceae bacterium]|nr:4Fe-4S binding protein [Chitinispirillaceae bacterium]